MSGPNDWHNEITAQNDSMDSIFQDRNEMTCASKFFACSSARVFALVVGLLLLGNPIMAAEFQTSSTPEGRGTVKKVSIHGGRVTMLADGLHKPFSLAVDQAHVYFSEAGAGTIKKVPTHGGRVIALAQGLNDPRDIAIDGDWLYFAERGRGTISKVSVHGGEVTTLARGLIGPMKIAVDADFVYFCEWAAQGAVKKVSKYDADGRVTTIIEGLTFPFGTSVVNRELFFVEQTGSGTLNKVGIDGSSRTVLLSHLVVPELLAFDQTHVYFAEGVGGTIKKVPLGGGTATVLATGLMVPGGTVVDDKNVYFVESESGTVKKVSKNGGPVLTLAQSLHDPFMIAVDGDDLYVTEGFNPHRDDRKLRDDENISNVSPPATDSPPFFEVADEKQLTFEGWSGNPVWSPDGSQIAYVSSDERIRSPGTGGDIWVMNSDGSGKHALTSDGLDNRYPSWSPDGQRIVFSSSRSGKYEVWVMEKDGSHPAQLTTHRKSNTLPVWSPDGREIVFASSRSGRTALWMMNPDGTEPRKISPEGGGPGAYYAAWSPDGTMLAFSSTKIADLTLWERFLSRWSRRDEILHDLANPEFGVPEHLRLLDLRNHELRQLTWGESVNHRPVWSPDGQFFVFVQQAEKGGDYRLAILHVRSGNIQKLPIESPEGMLPSWSPDGTRLAIQSTAPSGATIWVLTLESAGKKADDLAQATDHLVR